MAGALPDHEGASNQGAAVLHQGPGISIQGAALSNQGAAVPPPEAPPSGKGVSRHFSLHEVTQTQTPMWRGKLLDVWCDTVRLPDGGTATREYIRHPGAVVVVAIDEAGRVVMERQYRHPVGAVVEELPAGKLDPDESPLDCGERELREETGYTARTWRYLGTFWPCVGYSNEVLHVVLATDLTAGTTQLDAGEFLEVFLVPWEELLAQAWAGRLRDGKTLAALWFAHGAIAAEKAVAGTLPAAR